MTQASKHFDRRLKADVDDGGENNDVVTPAAETHESIKSAQRAIALLALGGISIYIIDKYFPDTPIVIRILFGIPLFLGAIQAVFGFIGFLFEGKEAKRFSVLGLLSIVVLTYFMHVLASLIALPYSIVDPFDTKTITLETYALYSADQIMKGLAFDLAEGLRVDITDIFDYFFQYSPALPAIEPRSPMAIIDAFFRTFVTGGVLFYLLALAGYKRGSPVPTYRVRID